MQHFDVEDHAINEIAAIIADSFLSKIPFSLFTVNCYANIGSGQEVFPSQELILNRTKEKYPRSKILYQVNKQVGFHDQKIGNAIRTIDTWYDDYEHYKFPLSAETYGSNTHENLVLRSPSPGLDFYTLFEKFIEYGFLKDKDQEHYIMSIFIRGGLFGQSGKE